MAKSIGQTLYPFTDNGDLQMNVAKNRKQTNCALLLWHVFFLT